MSDELMDPCEWLADAQAIAVGTKNKVTHLCGDASLVVYHNVDSWTAWCWRCHKRGWVPKEQPNMKERLARKEQQRTIDNAIRISKPPFPACFDLTSWSPAGRLWLYKAGLSPELIRGLGAYWHEASARVVLPVRGSDGTVVFWQARNPEYPKDGRPKYISSSTSRSAVHAVYGDESCGLVVLCEDILSAYKIGAAGYCGYAIMGTSLGQHTLAWLLQRGCYVLSWFDPDAAGQAARSEVGRTLSLVGCRVTHINTERDPKCYDLETIGATIRGYYTATDHARAEEILSAQADAQP